MHVYILSTFSIYVLYIKSTFKRCKFKNVLSLFYERFYVLRFLCFKNTLNVFYTFSHLKRLKNHRAAGAPWGTPVPTPQMPRGFIKCSQKISNVTTRQIAPLLVFITMPPGSPRLTTRKDLKHF